MKLKILLTLSVVLTRYFLAELIIPKCAIRTDGGDDESGMAAIRNQLFR